MRAGPAVLCAAAPVATKIPAPMIAPTPRLVSCTGPSTRLSLCSPFISSKRRESGFLAKRRLAILVHLEWYCVRDKRASAHNTNPKQTGTQASVGAREAYVDYLDPAIGVDEAGSPALVLVGQTGLLDIVQALARLHLFSDDVDRVYEDLMKALQ